MAQVTPTMTVQPPEVSGDGSILKVIWLLTTADSDGVAVSVPEYADKTWDIDGTSSGLAFGAATVAIQGGNTGTQQAILNPQTLSRADGSTAMTFTANAVKAVIENPLFMKPTLTVVGVGATIRITLVARRANPLRS